MNGFVAIGDCIAAQINWLEPAGRLVPIAASLLIGVTLGLAYFAVLWHAVGYLIKHPDRVALMVSSGVIRLMAVTFAFYWLSKWGAPCVLAGAAGMWMARWSLMRRIGRY
jgi:F1F0 ATPase subunit 2